MMALQYRKSVLRYGLIKLLGRRLPGVYTSALSPVGLREIPEPAFPTQQWVRIRPRLSGICGSDLATLCAKGSPYLAPMTSMPFVLGHEVVGVIQEIGGEVDGFAVGDRVVVRPALGCRVRGIEPLCSACADEHDALCRHVMRGNISAGIQTGYCRDTGGGWSESFVAHHSQLFAVPDSLSDQAAVLVEPFACAIHAVLRSGCKDDDTVLVMGCGAIGLLTIAALRATGSRARIVAVARHHHQKEHAKRLGADEILDSRGRVKDRYQRWAESLDAEVVDPELGKPAVIGGASIVFDCVANSGSLDDSIRFTRSGGRLILAGMPGIPSGVDWTPMWYKELSVRAAYAYGPERDDGGKLRDTFEVALELLDPWAGRLEPLVGDPFKLTDYRAAFRSALNTGASRVVKTVFAIDGERS